MNPERDLSNKYKYGFVFEVWGNDIRLVMKSKGFVCFWMIEHDYYFEEKVLSAKSFKGEKLQVNRTSLSKNIDITLVFSPLGYGVISGL